MSLETPSTSTGKSKTRHNTNCAVYGCHSRKGADRNIHFHYFPKNNSGIKVKILSLLGQEEEIDKRKAWEKVLLMGKPVTDNMRVCSKHFTKQDYISKDLKLKQPKLKRFAVPSLNLPKKKMYLEEHAGSSQDRGERSTKRQKIKQALQNESQMPKKVRKRLTFRKGIDARGRSTRRKVKDQDQDVIRYSKKRLVTQHVEELNGGSVESNNKPVVDLPNKNPPIGKNQRKQRFFSQEKGTNAVEFVAQFQTDSTSISIETPQDKDPLLNEELIPMSAHTQTSCKPKNLSVSINKSNLVPQSQTHHNINFEDYSKIMEYGEVTQEEIDIKLEAESSSDNFMEAFSKSGNVKVEKCTTKNENSGIKSEINSEYMEYGELKQEEINIKLEIENSSNRFDLKDAYPDAIINEIEDIYSRENSMRPDIKLEIMGYGELKQKEIDIK